MQCTRCTNRQHVSCGPKTLKFAIVPYSGLFMCGGFCGDHAVIVNQFTAPEAPPSSAWPSSPQSWFRCGSRDARTRPQVAPERDGHTSATQRCWSVRRSVECGTGRYSLLLIVSETYDGDRRA